MADLLASRESVGLDPRRLADRLRPTKLSDYVGQQHLLALDKPLGGLGARRQLLSMLLGAPPGTGKTTLAKPRAENAAYHWISVSAVLFGVKDIRDAVALAQRQLAQGRRTVLCVDEVHRFSKAQQDAFLPHVEAGTITFIGATTENPSFEVNAALLSRARVYVLQRLSDEELLEIASRGLQALQSKMLLPARRLFVTAADGDARRMLNMLEITAQLTDDEISTNVLEAVAGESLRSFYKGGDIFYQQISSLHKSLRGSAPDAALYWFRRMLDGGADPRYFGRRLLRIASVDAGNADPRGLQLTESALAIFERLGSPEDELALAQAVHYFASAPKSDVADQAFNSAMAFVRETPSHDLLMHLRNARTSLMKDLGVGEGYRHAHAENVEDLGAYAAGENYFLDELSAVTFYHPAASGLEDKIRRRLARLAQADASATQQWTQIQIHTQIQTQMGNRKHARQPQLLPGLGY